MNALAPASDVLPGYLTHTADRAVFGATPCLMVPRFGVLPDLDVGATRILAARSGLYLEARTRALSAVIQMVPAALPYGDVTARFDMAGGTIPLSLMRKIVTKSQRLSPKEWAGAVWWDAAAGEYRLWEPPLSGFDTSVGRVRFSRPEIDPLDMVLDVHSHGPMAAHFSGTDDEDDRAQASPLILSAVIGTCAPNQEVSTACRIVMRGLLREVPWRPWHDTE